MKHLPPADLEALCRRLLGPRFADLGRMISEHRHERSDDTIVFAALHDFLRNTSLGSGVSISVIPVPVSALGELRPSWAAVVVDECPPDHTWVVVECGADLACGHLRDVPVGESAPSRGSTDFHSEFKIVIPPSN